MVIDTADSGMAIFLRRLTWCIESGLMVTGVILGLRLESDLGNPIHSNLASNYFRCQKHSNWKLFPFDMAFYFKCEKRRIVQSQNMRYMCVTWMCALYDAVKYLIMFDRIVCKHL